MSDLKGSGNTVDLYVCNLPYDVTEENLKKDFAVCPQSGEGIGTVICAKIIRDRDTGKSKGYGFITVDKDEVEKFLAFNDSEYGGRKVQIRSAIKKNR